MFECGLPIYESPVKAWDETPKKKKKNIEHYCPWHNRNRTFAWPCPSATSSEMLHLGSLLVSQEMNSWTWTVPSLFLSACLKICLEPLIPEATRCYWGGRYPWNPSEALIASRQAKVVSQQRVSYSRELHPTVGFLLKVLAVTMGWGCCSYGEV